MSESQTGAGNRKNFENIKNPWDMLNNFCFYVYAQKSLFKVENVDAYFLTSSSLTSAPREFANHRAGSHISSIKNTINIITPSYTN